MQTTHITIDILLPTYNGETYIYSLISSLFMQSHKSWRLIIRDDGSTDKTMSILTDLSFTDSRITIINDHKGNLGPCQNFNELLKYSGANYIMFCDQDDIWASNKIEVMLNQIKLYEAHFPQSPILLVSDLSIIDESDNIVINSFWRYQSLSSRQGKQFNSLLINNIFPGCSMLFNAKLKSVTGNIPKQAIMHDWWFALTASAFGHIFILNEPYTFYRKHQNNSIGLSRSSFLQSLTRIITIRPNSINNLARLNDLPISIAARQFELQYKSLLSSDQSITINALCRYSIPSMLRYKMLTQPRLSNFYLYTTIIIVKIAKFKESISKLPKHP